MISGFRDFIMRGNVVDLAVAVVIGVAFAAVLNSFVADVLTPLLGLVGVSRLLDPDRHGRQRGGPLWRLPQRADQHSCSSPPPSTSS